MSISHAAKIIRLHHLCMNDFYKKYTFIPRLPHKNYIFLRKCLSQNPKAEFMLRVPKNLSSVDIQV